MRTIYKYQLKVADTQEIKMPASAKILCVQVQNESPYIWAVVETTNPTAARTIRVHGTGHPFHGDENDYIGTFQLHDGGLVFHVFETKTERTV